MEKSKLLLYCCKNKPDLVKEEEELYKKGLTGNNKYNTYNTNERGSCGYTLNGKIVAECDFEVEEIYYLSWMNEKLRERIYKESCLNDEQLSNYMDGHDTMYAIHIKNLNIFDKPKELCDFYNSKDYCKTWQPIKNAPQNMMYADYINIEKNIFRPYILISIRPEWLCKILNGEKTIEIRKKVLKEMMNNA